MRLGDALKRERRWYISGIMINNDSDLISQAASNNWPGNGSASNPFIIANLTSTAVRPVRECSSGTLIFMLS